MIKCASADGRLRCELARRGGHNAAVADELRLRVMEGRRALLGWSGLGIRVAGELRLDAAGAGLYRLVAGGSETVLEILWLGSGLAWRSAVDTTPRWRWPRLARGVVEREGELTRLPLANIVWKAERPVWIEYPHGRQALLGLWRRGGWLLAAAAPAEVPCSPTVMSLAGFAGWLRGAGCVTDRYLWPFLYPRGLSALSAEWGGWLGGLEGSLAQQAALELMSAPLGEGEEIFCLRGEVGEYLLVARKGVYGWRLAGISRKARVWTVRPSFLETDKLYSAVWRCDEQPDRPPFKPLPTVLDIASRPLVAMAEQGGFCLELVPQGIAE